MFSPNAPSRMCQAELAGPPVEVLAGVDVEGLLRATVVGQVSLLVAVEAERPTRTAPATGRLSIAVRPIAPAHSAGTARPVLTETTCPLSTCAG